MLVKCETKSNRVKGLAFHPKLSWILASLHNGHIQLWDYRISSLMDTFEEHEGGPVRGVCFHVTQPLFVSGGDDYKVKVWNFKQKRCIFTLLGHLDYIRTVQFHHDYPWILSSSDDQTVRIWNWQSRLCIAVLTGHNHYVMCAQFHPKEDMIVSASLDHTVRVWDTAGLRDRTSTSHGQSRGISAQDVFGTNDAVVKHVLEGHDRGVNWACFHSVLPLIVSGADDRLLKIWRMNDTKAWEVDTLKGHFNNVSSCCFLPTKDLIVSNSEDRTIRVWDANKRTAIHTFRRENDRFWILTAHPTSNLLAVGHDAGMVVFKLDRERPLFGVQGKILYTVHERNMMRQDITSTNSDPQPLVQLRRAPNAMVSGFKSMQVNPLNPAEANVLVHYTDGGSYDIIVNNQVEPGDGLGVAFTNRQKFAVLLQSGSIGIYNLKNELSKKFDAPIPGAVENIFFGGDNRLLLKSEDKVYMYCFRERKIIEETSVSGGARYCVWSPKLDCCALFSKHHLTITGKNLDFQYAIYENIRLKSGAWDENGVFIYSTQSHLKYCIPNGDRGIIHSLPEPIYIIQVSNSTMYYIDRSQKLRREKLNCTEFLFKLALFQRKFNDVNYWIKNGRLCGNVVIGYLKKKGFPHVALHFVDNHQTRFNLALEYGNIEEAMVSARALDDPNFWTRLGVEALRQGNKQIVEMVYQGTKNFDALSFLYLITGDLVKLQKMVGIAEKLNDTPRLFNNALMLGLVEERVKILSEIGQAPLAALTAKVHGLEDHVERLKESLPASIEPIVQRAKLCLPSKPVNTNKQSVNWPLAKDIKSIFQAPNLENVSQPQTMKASPEPVSLDDAFDDAGHADMDLDLGDLDLDLDDLGDLPEASPGKQEEQFQTLGRGESTPRKWLQHRRLPADFVYAGEFTQALNLLRRRIGLSNAAPLKPIFERMFFATHASIPGGPQIPSRLTRVSEDGWATDGNIQPRNLFNANFVIESLRTATQRCQFCDQPSQQSDQYSSNLAEFQSILQSLPLAVCEGAEDERRLLECLEVAKDYTLALRIQVAFKELQKECKAESEEMRRCLELAALLTVCKVNATNFSQSLVQAMPFAYKAGNFLSATSFARRLLETNVGQTANGSKLVLKARKLLQSCEARGTEAIKTEFDYRADVSSIVICSRDLIPIPAGAKVANCPFCSSKFKNCYNGQVCSNCNLSEIGAEVLGVQFRPI